MNAATIAILAPYIASLLGAIAAGVFLIKRLRILSELAGRVNADGLAQGRNVETKISALTGGFTSKTSDAGRKRSRSAGGESSCKPP